jgi:hypothetical protein
MTAPLLTTKLYIPPPRPNLVSRPRRLVRKGKPNRTRSAFLKRSGSYAGLLGI